MSFARPLIAVLGVVLSAVPPSSGHCMRDIPWNHKVE